MAYTTHCILVLLILLMKDILCQELCIALMNINTTPVMVVSISFTPTSLVSFLDKPPLAHTYYISIYGTCHNKDNVDYTLTVNDYLLTNCYYARCDFSEV